MEETDKKCPDCGGDMRAIKIFDNARYGSRPTPGKLNYTAPEAKPSYWTGRFPVEGTVSARMCTECGRILLYGEPRAEAGT